MKAYWFKSSYLSDTYIPIEIVLYIKEAKLLLEFCRDQFVGHWFYFYLHTYARLSRMSKPVKILLFYYSSQLVFAVAKDFPKRHAKTLTEAIINLLSQRCENNDRIKFYISWKMMKTLNIFF